MECFLLELTHNEIEMLSLALDMIEILPGGLTPTEQGIRRKLDRARSLPLLETQ